MCDSYLKFRVAFLFDEYSTKLVVLDTEKHKHNVVASIVTTTAHTGDEQHYRRVGFSNTRQHFYRDTSTLETQIATIAKQLSSPRTQN